jgi:DegV family protein with EDD domain
MRAEMNASIVPLAISLGAKLMLDDEALLVSDMLSQIAHSKEKLSSGAPAPARYLDAMRKAATSFVVTLSSRLSGSYASAMVAKEMAEEEGRKVYVVDSKSASAGEVLLAIKIHEMIKQKWEAAKIYERAKAIVKDMKTYFVLENLDVMVKNGRLHKITSKLLTALTIRPILGSDGDGNVALFSHARGQKQAVEKLADTIEKSGKNTEGETLVIAHCNNISMAERLKELIDVRYAFRDIWIVATRGISSMYASDKGIIMAF